MEDPRFDGLQHLGVKNYKDIVDKTIVGIYCIDDLPNDIDSDQAVITFQDNTFIRIFSRGGYNCDSSSIDLDCDENYMSKGLAAKIGLYPKDKLAEEVALYEEEKKKQMEIYRQQNLLTQAEKEKREILEKERFVIDYIKKNPSLLNKLLEEIR